MTADILDPAVAQRIVFHAEASRYTTIAGFTILIVDHICTLEEEVTFMWSAPRSLVKILFLVNRYITPIFQAFIVYEMSRLAVFSNTFCKWWTTINGFVEVSSMATSDLLLLFRVHALWGGRRSVVVGTSAIYAFAYTCIVVVGAIGAFDIIPMLHYDPLARMCTSTSVPKVMPAMWSVSLLCELTVFVMTTIKAFEHHTSENSHSPLIKTLYYDQFLYYVIIIVVRIFNLLIWLVLPKSLFFLGVYFIWSLITALVSRIMLHLRRVACAHPQLSGTTFLGETVKSTRIVWARQNDAQDTSTHFIGPQDGSGPISSTEEATVCDEGEERGNNIMLRGLQSENSRVRDGGEP